jgi:DNA-binding SARP family transcriptional activator
VVAEEPTNEEAHTGLMRLYAFSGQRQSALAQYERLRKTLSGELGTESNAMMRRLRDEIAAGRLPPTHLAATPPEEPPDAKPGTVPTALLR